VPGYLLLPHIGSKRGKQSISPPRRKLMAAQFISACPCCGHPAPLKNVVAPQQPAITVEFCQKIIAEMGRIIGELQAELDKGKAP
jgi:hypothetical protein